MGQEPGWYEASNGSPASGWTSAPPHAACAVLDPRAVLRRAEEFQRVTGIWLSFLHVADLVD